MNMIPNHRVCFLVCSAVKPATNKSTEDFEGPFKPAKTLKQGSVLDLLKTPGETQKNKPHCGVMCHS